MSTRCARARNTAAIWNKMKFGHNNGRVKLRGCLLVAILMRIAVGTAWTHSVRTKIPRLSASDWIMVAVHSPNGTEDWVPPGPAPTASTGGWIPSFFRRLIIAGLQLGHISGGVLRPACIARAVADHSVDR